MLFRSGPESSGKSTLAMHVVAEAQRNGGICAYVDAEHAMDPVYAKAIGVDIDPQRIQEANELAKRTGADKQVRFIQGDLFETDISEATVVTLYLLTRLNLKLRPKLMKELKPGTRIVSHAFDMGDWQPEKTESVVSTTIYLWRIPPA